MKFYSKNLTQWFYSIAVVSVSAGCSMGGTGFGTDSVNGAQTVPITGHVRADVASQAKDLGRVDAATPVSISVALALRDGSELAALIARLYNRNDTIYGHYLTTNEFVDRFAPSAADVDRVTAFLQAHGLSIQNVHANRLVIEASGTAAQIEKAFQVELHQYQKLSKSFAVAAMVRAPLSEPQVDASIAHLITGIVGLNTFGEHHMHISTPRDGLKPRGTGPGGGLSPADIQSAYQLDSLSQNGSGETLALFELDGYTSSDVVGYAKQFNISNPPKLQNVLVSGATGAAGDGAVEVTLDIQLMMAVAPGASKILVYEGPNSDAGVVATYSKIASDNQAREISTSWGEAELSATSSTIQSENNIFMQMASQGQSIFAASGDSGAFDDGSTLSVDDPASQPYVTGVGGTRLTLSGSEYGSESAWSTPASGSQQASGGGGGISAVWKIPDWQSGVGNSTNKGSSTQRMVPDVSLEADPSTGYALYYQGQWGIVGGTSCAAPIWAAFAALVNQQQVAKGATVLGFANPALYQVGGSPAYASSFHDVNDGSTNLSYPTVKGYDLATGWGSFNGAGLLTALTGSVAPAPTPTGATPAPTPGSTTQAATPLLNGSALFQTSDPSKRIKLSFDVSNIPGAAAVYIEVSQPNGTLSSPDGVTPDPNAYGDLTEQKKSGTWRFSPEDTLPDWGTYQIRVLPLTEDGQPAGTFSEPATLVLSQTN